MIVWNLIRKFLVREDIGLTKFLVHSPCTNRAKAGEPITFSTKEVKNA